MTSLDFMRIGAAAYEMGLLGYTYFTLLHRRFGKRISGFLYAMFSVLSCVKHFLLFDRMEIRTVLQFLLCLSVAFLLFTDPFFKKLGALLLYAGTMIVTESILMLTAALLGERDIFDAHEVHADLLFATLFLATIALLLLVPHFAKQNAFEKKSQRFVLIYCLMQLITALIMYSVLWDYKIQTTPLMIFYLIMLAASVLFGIYLLRMVRAATAEQARAERLALQAKLADEHFRRLQIQYEQYRKLRHDYYNHIGVIRTINDPEKRAAYIDELTQKIEDRNGIAFCSNVALDALLFNEKAQADAAGVKISYKIGDLSDVKIPDFDVCTVLSNLLDNAIRAAAECEGERFVELTMTVSAGQLAIRVANSAKEPEKDLSTTKQDRALHGLGLSIVTETAQKYHGAAAYTYENGVFSSVFSACAGGAERKKKEEEK